MKKMIIFCILAVLVLMASGCKTDIVEEQETESETPLIEEPVIEEKAVEEPKEMLSGLRCAGDKIEAVITNVGDRTLELTKDIKIMINGLPPVADPECDKLILEPGESTICSDISGHYSIREGRVNTIQLNFYGGRVFESVKCE